MLAMPDRLCGERCPIYEPLARTSLPLARCLRWAMQSPNSRRSTTSLSNSWSECRTTCGHPLNVPSALRACHSKSSVLLKDWANLASAQLKNRSTAGTLLVRERPSRPPSQPFQECGSREFHRVVLICAHAERNGFERMKVLVTCSSGLIGSR